VSCSSCGFALTLALALALTTTAAAATTAAVTAATHTSHTIATATTKINQQYMVITCATKIKRRLKHIGHDTINRIGHGHVGIDVRPDSRGKLWYLFAKFFPIHGFVIHNGATARRPWGSNPS
jgi:hypothetical protein